MTKYQSGSTVKLTANFIGLDNTVFDPDSIDSIKIYTPDKTELASYTQSNLTKISTGIYCLYYTLPVDYGYLFHEWNYTYNSISDLIRSRIDIAFL